MKKHIKALIASYKRKLEIWSSDYGRSEGWLLELDGEAIAHLIDRKPGSMFWENYAIVAMPRAKELGVEVESEAFWRDYDFKRLQLRSRRVNEYAEHAFPAIDPFQPENRVSMRALYIDINAPHWWDCIAIALYKRINRKKRLP